MAIDYDKLNQAYQAQRTVRQAFLDGIITVAELKVELAKIEADIQSILSLPEPPPP